MPSNSLPVPMAVKLDRGSGRMGPRMDHGAIHTHNPLLPLRLYAIRACRLLPPRTYQFRPTRQRRCRTYRPSPSGPSAATELPTVFRRPIQTGPCWSSHRVHRGCLLSPTMRCRCTPSVRNLTGSPLPSAMAIALRCPLELTVPILPGPRAPQNQCVRRVKISAIVATPMLL